MNLPSTIPFVALGAWLCTTAAASAQPIFAHAESIECTVANADLVVVGRLVDFAHGEQAAEPDTREWREATIAIEQTLKGGHHESLRLRFRHSDSTLAEWNERSSRLLVSAKGDPLSATTVIDLADRELAVLTADFALLRNSDAVIRFAQESIRRMPGVQQIETFTLYVPFDAIAGTRWAEYHATTLSVPVEERLEKRARDFIQSESSQRREEGVRALRYFRSDENIARVKGLLNDPAWGYLAHPQENMGLEVRLYGVRREAYRTLKYWGVSVDKPLIREEIRRKPACPD